MEFVKKLWKDTWKVYLVFFKILIPVSISIKILKEFGIIDVIGGWIAPIMDLVGLPGAIGIAWFTAIVSNIYGGIIALLVIPEASTLTVAQMTIFTTLVLFAHNFPMEVTLAQRAGARAIPQMIIRLLSGFLAAMLLSFIFNYFNLYQDIAHPFLKPNPTQQTWSEWAVTELINYLKIAGVILALLLFLRTLEWFRIDRMIAKALSPILRLVGIGTEVTTVTLVGMLMGLAYGGAIISVEAKERNLNKRSIFYAMTLMGMLHSLVEDTFLPLLVDAKWFIILLIRLVFGIVITRIIVLLTVNRTQQWFERWLITKKT